MGALEATGLAEVAGRKLKGFSGGMKGTHFGAAVQRLQPQFAIRRVVFAGRTDTDRPMRRRDGYIIRSRPI